MNTLETFSELARAVRDLIRIGVVSDIDTEQALCRVQTGELVTNWLHWLTPRAGNARTWWAPSVGEQVLILSLGGELDTGFVLPAIYSDDFPAPSVSAQAYHIRFSDGAVMEYEPDTGTLAVSGIKTASVVASTSVSVTAPNVTVIASQKITLDTPEVVCTNKLTTGSLEVKQGGAMTGNVTHSGGAFTSNGIQVDTHKHSGVQTGGGNTGGPQ
ncbi:MAG: phage baseplate assembly protein V [Rouxiella aceris]|uniref:phage baseplate assembly protein V n=1 Tax=Rouxiella aceris TaxID=2703884 RepID=UPI0028408375|nr:phage baseplate assembly protein V [Rouxiella aceris]MDR3434024.1 phage baseplate assembly protein V [Rouxiella aceris]